MFALTSEVIESVKNLEVSGYTIIEARAKKNDLPCYGIALAQSANTGRFVTWQFHKDTEDEPASFYWGHYYEDEEPAQWDYMVRDWSHDTEESK